MLHHYVQMVPYTEESRKHDKLHSRVPGFENFTPSRKERFDVDMFAEQHCHLGDVFRRHHLSSTTEVVLMSHLQSLHSYEDLHQLYQTVGQQAVSQLLDFIEALWVSRYLFILADFMFEFQNCKIELVYLSISVLIY